MSKHWFYNYENLTIEMCSYGSIWVYLDKLLLFLIYPDNDLYIPKEGDHCAYL